MTTYIFGYGSLISSKSRKLSTSEISEETPVLVYGFTRGWFARTKISSLSTTFLGLIEFNSPLNSFSSIDLGVNGVLYEIDPNEIGNLDTREKNYKRIEIQRDKVKILNGKQLPECKIYTYINLFEEVIEFDKSLPTKEFPIVQSYVDICINGCLEIEEKWNINSYTSDFINSTFLWSKWWANDRLFPRRAHQFEPNSNRIDLCLKMHETTKNLYNQIYIE